MVREELLIISCEGVIEPEVAEEISDRVVEHDIRRIVLNVKSSPYIRSIALGPLILTQRRLREGGGEMVLSQPGVPFLRIWRALGLCDLFRHFESDDEAMAHLGIDATNVRGKARRVARIVIRPI